MQLTLIIPELIWPQANERSAFSATAEGKPIAHALSKLLARSSLQRAPQQALEYTLAQQFTWPPALANDFPYAALRQLGESSPIAPESGTAASDTPDANASASLWLCADPVHLNFQQDKFIVVPGDQLELSLNAMQTLAADLNHSLAGLTEHIGLKACLSPASAERWYLALTAPTASAYAELAHTLASAKIQPLSHVAGQALQQPLPETKAARSLRKLLNEIQMLLHVHPFNTARSNAGQSTLNSLWLWGSSAEALPIRLNSPFQAVWSTQTLAIGLARAAQIAQHNPPSTAAKLFAQMQPGEHHLVLLEDLIDATQKQEAEAYRNTLGGLDQGWFAPLHQALRKRQLRRLNLISSSAYGNLHWHSTALDQWKIWRTTPSLCKLAKTLAESPNENR
ncbi:MAG: hypothetical protein V4623_01630 [Pseudomonadota bacterium]